MTRFKKKKTTFPKVHNAVLGITTTLIWSMHNLKRQLYSFNVPWSQTVFLNADFKNSHNATEKALNYSPTPLMYNAFFPFKAMILTCDWVTSVISEILLGIQL